MNGLLIVADPEPLGFDLSAGESDIEDIVGSHHPQRVREWWLPLFWPVCVNRVIEYQTHRHCAGAHVYRRVRDLLTKQLLHLCLES